MGSDFPGRGRSRSLFDIPIAKLHVDADNPRFLEENWGKPEEGTFELLYNSFDLDELAISLLHNGYFDEEPLVAVPKNLPTEFKDMNNLELKSNNKYEEFIKNEKTELIVVEGNRRLTAIKILLNPSLRQKLKVVDWGTPTEDIRKDLEILPVVVYSNKEDVLPYLGVRHITGI